MDAIMDTMAAVYPYVVCFSTILFAIELFFCLPTLPRRHRFGLRAAILIPTYAIVFNSWNVMSYLGFGWPFALFDILLFFVSVVVLWQLFDAPFTLVLFYASAAYATESLVFYIRRAERYFPVVLEWGAAWQVLRIVLIVTLLSYIYLRLVRRYRGVGNIAVSRGFLVAFVVAVLVVTNLLNSWVGIEKAQGPIYASYAVICDFLLLFIQFDVFLRSGLEQEREITRQIMMEREKQQRLAQQNAELINIKCHDLKHQIAALRDMSDATARDRSIGELEQAVLIYDSVVHTGNHVLDTILTQRSMLCESKGINLACIADGSRLEGLSTVDLYTLFGNALDNAIEAAEKIEDPERRVISLRVAGQGSLTSIVVENSCVGPVEMDGGLPRTSKGDTDYHGFGLKSIAMIVEKLGGNMSIEAGDDVFTLRILLPAAQLPAPER